MQAEYPIWRVWLRKDGMSLDELRYEWTYEDILKANALLDMEEDYRIAYKEDDANEFERKRKKK